MIFFQQSGCLIHYYTNPKPKPPKLFVPSHSKSNTKKQKQLQPLCENTQPPRIRPKHQIHAFFVISILLPVLLLLLSKSSSRLFPNSTQLSSHIFSRMKTIPSRQKFQFRLAHKHFPNSSRIWQEFATCNARGPRT